MTFEHKAVVVACPSGVSSKREALVQEVLDKHREWRLVSTAVLGGWELVLCFTREV